MTSILSLIWIPIAFLLIYFLILFIFKKCLEKVYKPASVLGSILLVIVTGLLFVSTSNMVKIADKTKEQYGELHKENIQHEINLQHREEKFKIAMLLLESSNEIYRDKEFRNKIEKYISNNFHREQGEILKELLARKIDMIKVPQEEIKQKKEISKEILEIEYTGWIYLGNYDEKKESWVAQPEIFRYEPHKSSLKFEYETTHPRDLLNNEYNLTTNVRIRIGAPLPYGEEPEKIYFVPVKGWLEKGELVKILKIENTRKDPMNSNVKRVWARVQYRYLPKKIN